MSTRSSEGRWGCVIAVCAAGLLAGCENAGQGAVSGGAIGALGGLAIGSLTGSAGAGAAIGAVSGAVAGGVLGDQNRRAREQQAQMRSTP
jgi:outer membrane lipoprotein SlyB